MQDYCLRRIFLSAICPKLCRADVDAAKIISAKLLKNAVRCGTIYAYGNQTQTVPETGAVLRQYRILKNSHFNLPKSTARHRLFWHQEEKM